MKKIVLSTLLVLFSTMAANALIGPFNIGARLGLISSSEQIPMKSGALEEAITAEGTGWTGTVFARVNLSKHFFLQPELQYTKTTIDLPSFTLDGLLGKEEEVESHRYIDLPILLGFEFGLGGRASLRLNAGPVFAIASEKGFSDLVEDDFIAAYKTPSVSWTAGIGARILGGIIADFRYNGNFSDSKFDIKDPLAIIDTNTSSWNLSIGIMF